MIRPTIYTDKNMSIEDAVEYMSDNWIDDGQYCQQTVIDMKNAIVFLLKQQKESKRIIK